MNDRLRNNFLGILCGIFLFNITSCSPSIPYVKHEEITDKQAMLQLESLPIWVSVECCSLSQSQQIRYTELVEKILKKKGLQIVSRPNNKSGYYHMNCQVDGEYSAQCALSNSSHQQVYSSIGSGTNDRLVVPKLALGLATLGLYLWTEDYRALSLYSALAGLDKYLDEQWWYASPNETEVDVFGFDDGIKEDRNTDYHEAIFDAKLNALKASGSRILKDQRLTTMSDSNGYNESWHDEEVELLIDSILLPGFTIEDWGYVDGRTYKVRLKGHVITK